VIVVDQTMRSMRDAVRVTKMFDEDVPGGAGVNHRNIFVVNRIGEAGQHALPIKDIEKVLQVAPTTEIPFLPALVTAAAHNALVAASRRGKFADAISVLASELTGRKPRRNWFWGRAK